MADFGYDVSDYCDVDPVFGTLADFDRLLADAHERGLRVARRLGAEPHLRPAPVVRRVPVEPRRPEARTGTCGATRRPDGGPPNNWIGGVHATAPAWTFDDADRPVLPAPVPARAARPELGATPRSIAAMHDTLRFWLDRGVDGFRIDVVHAIGKDPDAARRPARARRASPTSPLNDRPATHELLRGHPRRCSTATPATA